jgi:adenylate kinase
MKVVENSRTQLALGRNVIIFLGGPGAGKGTQAGAISEWLKVPHISSGRLLRSEVAAATPFWVYRRKRSSTQEDWSETILLTN